MFRQWQTTESGVHHHILVNSAYTWLKCTFSVFKTQTRVIKGLSSVVKACKSIIYDSYS